MVRALAVWANYKLAVPGSNPGGSILRLCACALVRCARALVLVRLWACAYALVLVRVLSYFRYSKLEFHGFSSGFSLLSL